MNFDEQAEELKGLLPQGLLADWVRIGHRLARLIADRRHPGTHEAVLGRLLDQARKSIELRRLRAENVPFIDYPPDLPITARKDDIVAAIRENQVVVIAGETGSGKTTQIPKMCLEAGLGIEAKIACTQPRRVAALSVSRRIAEELNVAWGKEVGCKIRFDDQSTNRTYIKMMTDGMLLAEMQGDRFLADYNVIIIDEAHERSLNIDFLLGHLRNLLTKRQDLKLIITSATIDTASFSKAFGDAPVIEVSGRLYPVEVVYMPLDSDSEERGDLTYVDAAVAEVENVMSVPGGDVLVFMPGERDIREVSDLVEGRLGRRAEVVPLFGRLSAAEQQRVFSRSSRRKIVIATNIAETSLTIPGIQYVIDSGLVRISRYNPRTRTSRLPVEPVSQSSANQRKGRSGRMSDGVCIRLYSEEDFEGRPAHTQPEIQRCNLAEVILRMVAFGLGEIETFPFLNPPSGPAIQSGYKLLQELGALDEERQLTRLGQDLARLPIDPTLGRMLLQSEKEHATRELLIIAAGLSIQDPRERPLDQKEAAAAAHKQFLDPRSDFLTLLNIWNALHEEWEHLRTQNQRRKFCRARFLSYLRMREWQDLHAQLYESLEEFGDVHLNESNASYDAIHRSIATGLWGHVGNRISRNLYRVPGNRQASIFPGSTLFDRRPESKKKKAKARVEVEAGEESTRQPRWAMAGELVETSRLFIRTVAEIDPAWIVELASHLCQFKHVDPRWDAKAGRVLVKEKISLFGLEVLSRPVDYGKINPAEATAIFIRCGLVEETLEVPHRFYQHNCGIRHKVDNWRTKIRRSGFEDLDETLFQFYASRMEGVSSVHDLNRLVNERVGEDPDFLCVSESDLVGNLELSDQTGSFPDRVEFGGQNIDLRYTYAPGEETDGVTVRLPLGLAQTVSAAAVDWAVPGLREGQLMELLRSLPKGLRRELMPFAPKVTEIMAEFQPSGSDLTRDLAEFIYQKYGFHIPAAAWSTGTLTHHLRPRVEILGRDREVVTSGRDLNDLCRRLGRMEASEDTPLWARAAAQWERYGVREWSFGELPERVELDGSGALIGWPGLEVDGGAVNVRLFRTREASRTATLPGIQRLVEIGIERELGWLGKDLRALRELGSLYVTIGGVEELEETALTNIRTHLLPGELFSRMEESEFTAAVERARGAVTGLAPRFLEWVREILVRRQELLMHPTPHPNLRAVLDYLLPARFLEIVPFEQLPHVPRYLQAMRVRSERAVTNAHKDQERVRQVMHYNRFLQELRGAAPRTREAWAQVESIRWMIEEFKVSLFAQELGTAYPVSPRRLDERIAEVKRGLGL